jgi:hypothetical protein
MLYPNVEANHDRRLTELVEQVECKQRHNRPIAGWRAKSGDSQPGSLQTIDRCQNL